MKWILSWNTEKIKSLLSLAQTNLVLCVKHVSNCMFLLYLASYYDNMYSNFQAFWECTQTPHILSYHQLITGLLFLVVQLHNFVLISEESSQA